ncbi:SDR family oxidoreductase [Amycolatopsis circi]|uniref:SDR family oxidoreductase n=1 Tax=Amycolatopsis circi TaxID=871959 RepID=UPI000E23D9BA|nr:NmrA family NAD(P)-binding protein [Amycolatopsis circi]
MADKRYLVIGAGGFQGGAVARALLRRGCDVLGFARRGGPSAFRAPGVPLITGDLADPASVRAAFDGITHASVVLPLVYDAELVSAFARNVVEAARAAGVVRLVYNTNTPIPAEPTGLPAYETRRAAEGIFRESGLPVVVLRPPVYLDNLFSPWTGRALVNDGVLLYPLSASRKVAWLSHTDLAEATVAALDAPGIEGTVLRLAGADVVDGPGLAAAFGSALGREITYIALDVGQFQAVLGEVFGERAAAGVAGIYEYAEVADPWFFAASPAPAERALGIRPGRIQDWVAVQPWEVWARA